MRQPVATLTVDMGGFPNLTVRIDGDLPTVVERSHSFRHNLPRMERRPLRVGDRVTLATDDVPTMENHWNEMVRPFATATVIRIEQQTLGIGETHWLVTVIDVKGLS